MHAPSYDELGGLRANCSSTYCFDPSAAESIHFSKSCVHAGFVQVLACSVVRKHSGQRSVPSRARQTVAADLTMAGSRMNPTMFLGIRTPVMFGLPLFGLLYPLSTGGVGTTEGSVIAVTLIWGRRLPTMWLKRRMRSRQRAIDRGLPYSLDLMVACLEGGLSLDASLVKVVEQTDGPLASEIRKRSALSRLLGESPALPRWRRVLPLPVTRPPESC